MTVTLGTAIFGGNVEYMGTRTTCPVLIASLIVLFVMPQRAEAYGFLERSTSWKGEGRVEFVVNMTNAPPASTEKQILEFVQRGLEVWNQVETSRLTFTLGKPIDDPAKNRAEADGMNVIFWQELSGRRTDNVAGKAHSFATDCDIQLLPMSPYTLLDVQALVMHELGHCMGLAHSAVTGVMTKFQGFPVLSKDDVAGASILNPHPTQSLKRRTVTLTGRIMRGSRPLVGALLSVFDRRTGHTVLAGFSGLVDGQRRKDSSGRFELLGLSPGRFKLLVEPMNVFVADNPTGFGAPVQKPPEPFRRLSIDLPELAAGDTHDVGKLKVTEP